MSIIDIDNMDKKNIQNVIFYNFYSEKQNKVIDIYVEESPTGEIFAGAGTGTSGATITAGIKEKNYLGKGIKLISNLF